MVDIHTHILPLVDDGSGSVNDSFEMLYEQVEFGVTDVFLTPHLRHRYNVPKNLLEKYFSEFSQAVKQKNIPVNLYLGQEIYLSPDKPHLPTDEEVVTLNGSKYVLIEFDFTIPTDIPDAVYEAIRRGYKPIVCHLERYSYADLQTAYAVKETGGLIQLNADSITGNDRSAKRFAKKLLKFGLADFVASDVHSRRKNRISQAYGIVKKKYGVEYAEDLFTDNAKKILNGKDL